MTGMDLMAVLEERVRLDEPAQAEEAAT